MPHSAHLFYGFSCWVLIGGNESTRSSQAVAPVGHFASGGLLFTCRPGYFGSVPGLDTASCSGPCSVPGFFCPGKI